MPRISTASSTAARGYGFSNTQPTAFAPYQITKSLRNVPTRNQYLYRLPGGAIDGNRRTYTESFWFRQMAVNTGAAESAGNWIGAVAFPGMGGNHGVYNYGNGTIATFCYYNMDGINTATGQWQGFLYTLPGFRDNSAWYHIVWSVDTTQPQPENRQKLYINGQLQTSFKTYESPGTGNFINRAPTYPNLNQITEFGNTSGSGLYINSDSNGGARFNGYLAELHWVDGQALDASVFGYYDSNGEWQPKPYAGTYGKFGFYLPFIDDSTHTSIGKDYSRALKPSLTYPENSDEYFGAVSLLTQTLSSRSLSGNNIVFRDYSSLNNPVSSFSTACQGSPSPFYLPGETYDVNKYDGSLYLRGINDCLRIPYNPAFSLGNKDFTIECWVKTDGVNRNNASSPVLNQSTGGASDYNSAFFFGIGSDVGIYLSEGRGTWDQFTQSTGRTIADGCWHHVAAVRSGDRLLIFIDGVQCASQLLPTGYTVSFSDRPIEVGTQAGQIYFTGGLIYNLRMVVGTAVYTSSFTPPTSPLTNIPNTVLLLKFRDAAIVDATSKFVFYTDTYGSGTGTNALCAKYSRGIETHDSAVTVFNAYNKFWSNIGTDFTVETWYVCISGSDVNIFNIPARDLTSFFALNYNHSSKAITGYTNSGVQFTSNNRILTAWTHIAWVRSKNVLTLYLNGSAVDTRSFAGNLGYNIPAYLRLGTQGSLHRSFYDQFRFTQGVARYTTNFIPPTAAFAVNGSATFFQPISFLTNEVNALTYSDKASYNESPTDFVYSTSNSIISSYDIKTYILSRNSNLTVSNSGLTVNTGAAAAQHRMAVAKTTLSAGKYYWEVTAGTEAGSINIFGMAPLSSHYTDGIYTGLIEGFGYGYSTTAGLPYAGPGYQTNIAAGNFGSIANQSVLGFAYDAQTGNAWVRNSTGWLGGGDPAAGTTPAWTRLVTNTTLLPLAPAVSLYNTTAATGTTFNFGLRPYTYTPPAGFSDIVDITYEPGVRGTFCTVNPVGPRVGQQPTVTAYAAAGELDCGMAAANIGGTASQMWIGTTFGLQTGKWYFEATYIPATVNTADAIGLKESNIQPNATNYWMNNTITDFFMLRQDGNKKTGSASSVLHRQAIQRNDIVGVAYDADAGNLWFSVNGTFLANGNPVSGINAAFTTLDGLSTSKAYVPVFSCYGSGGVNTRTWDCNFGARPYAFRPPTGFRPLCTAVLPLTSNTGLRLNQINRAFNVTAYTGGNVIYNTDPLAGGLELALPLNGYQLMPTFWNYDACNIISNGQRPRKPLVNNNVTISANPDTSFLYASAAFFNGSTANLVYSNVAFNEFVLGTQNFCVEGWVYPIEHRGPTAAAQTIVYTSNTTDQAGIWFGIQAGTNTWYWLAGNGTWNWSRDTGILATSGRWHHFAYVRENSEFRLYLNGQLIDTVTGRTESLTNADSVITIGGRVVASQYYRGYIQDVRVYKNFTKYVSNFTPPSAITSRIINTENAFGNPVKQIQNIPFQPDLVWIKSRGTQSTQPHGLHDVIRGADNLLSTVYSNNSSNTTFYLSSYNINGFTVRETISANTPGLDYVAWNWKAGQSTELNTNGTIASRVNVNKQTGLSIFRYTGNSTFGATVGHGLDMPPSFIIVKGLSANLGFPNNNWWVQHVALASNEVIKFNLTDAASVETAGTGSTWNITKANSNVITLGDQAGVNRLNGQYIGYAWCEVTGYSKFGSYVGNGNADGPFVYCGFKPRLILLKGRAAGRLWVIKDTARTTSNGYDYEIYNTSITENSYYTNPQGPVIDFYGNGFKIRSTASETNTNAETFIYCAFAEIPYRFARGC
ncbi:MAG: hypothetical protein EBU90_02305 [Proteobacteria bacterium]|nr:hypothetical protein [Pseudomonadota bacterium]NBP13067.1 hypothetical protein [bacterium]